MLTRLLHRIRRHAVLIGVFSIGWLILRSGTKPSRINYPCQQVAKANTLAALTMICTPILAMVQSMGKSVNMRSFFTVIIAFILLASAYTFLQPKPNSTISEYEVLSLKPVSVISPSSSVYAVNGYTGINGGLAKLVDLMGNNGVSFYNSSVREKNSGPNGLIAVDDVVLIKVNSQWNQRGGTNTDLLRELITLITSHPGGFNGEVIIADNGQAQYGSQGQGGSFNWAQSNAEDKTQSVQVVVDSFTRFNVSTYQWDIITSKRVFEFSSGDYSDGYVVEEGIDPESRARLLTS